MKKVLTLTGDLKRIFMLQDVNSSVNNFWSFFSNLKRSISQQRNLAKTYQTLQRACVQDYIFLFFLLVQYLIKKNATVILNISQKITC